MESARIEIEELLRESRWLRRLARHLVADPAEADDVAQQTYLAALASPPPVEREVRPWLTRVARNVVRSRYRADRRRRCREQAAVDRADVVAPDQLLEQVELQRILAELVAGLPEPYRAVIALRFYRDRSAADIAAAEGIPAATIRWRIQRGLELLRVGLDGRHGVESAELLPVAGDPPYEELVECMRETTFAAVLERPRWFVGRTAFHFPILLGSAAHEPYVMDGPGPIGRAVLERMRSLERGSH